MVEFYRFSRRCSTDKLRGVAPIPAYWATRHILWCDFHSGVVESVVLGVHGPVAGLRLVKELAADPRIADHYRLDAVRAHLFEMAGDRPAALAHYRAVASRTSSTPERNYLIMKAGKLDALGRC